MLGDAGRGRPVLVVAVLAVAVLAVTAGCMGFGAGTDDGNGATLTPTETPGGSDDLPEAVSTNGSVDIDRLVAGHAEALSSDSYRMQVNISREVIQEGNSRTENVSQTATVQADGTFTTQFHQESGPITFDRAVWGNDSVAVSRSATDQQLRYGRENPKRIYRNASGRVFLAQFLRMGNYSVAEVDRDAGTVTLEATSPDAGFADIEQVEAVERYEGTVVVDFQGRIHRMTADAAYTASGGTVIETELQYDLMDVGDASVDRPEWVPEALSETAGTS